MLDHQPVRRHVKLVSPEVLHPLVAMQRVADYVGRHGYHWWTGGVVDLAKVSRLRRKFAAAYGIDLHRNTRSRHKKAGWGAAVLLLYHGPRASLPAASYPEVEPSCHWILLVAPGEHAAFALEDLRDARTAEGRFRLGPYELIQATRPGSSRPAWSFRMEQAYCEDYRRRIIGCARGDPREPVGPLLRALRQEPGWRPVRVEIGHLMGLLRREWGRRHGRRARLPAISHLPYVQRLPNGLAVDLNARGRG